MVGWFSVYLMPLRTQVRSGMATCALIHPDTWSLGQEDSGELKVSQHTNILSQIHTHNVWQWWRTPLATLGRQRLVNLYELETSLVYTSR